MCPFPQFTPAIYECGMAVFTKRPCPNPAETITEQVRLREIIAGPPSLKAPGILENWILRKRLVPESGRSSLPRHHRAVERGPYILPT